MDIYEEKARDLIHLMFPSNFSQAKECAIVAVNEIIKNIDATFLYVKEESHEAIKINKDYWFKVLTKLKSL